MSYLWYWPEGGWDFDRWRAARPELPISAEGAGPVLPGKATLEAWECEQVRLRARLSDLLGTITDQPPAAPRWEFLGAELTSSEGAGYTLRRLRYALTDTDQEWGYAWLLRPLGNGTVRRPAVIALHPTTPHGKMVTAGLEAMPPPKDGRDYGRELALEGFVVLVPDAIAFGERQAGHPNSYYRSADQFYATHPDGSVMAKMAYDTSRAVDLLQELPDVDPARIGCIGHSHGGYGTLFAMLADERIGAGVISCGLSPFRTDPGVDRWWRRTALLPRVGLYEGRMEQAPLDLEHLLALVAPRPLLIAAARADACFPELESMPGLIGEARRVYDLYGTGDALRDCFFDGAHYFPVEARRAGYDLLRATLGLSEEIAG